jgi:phosphate transport system protein
MAEHTLKRFDEELERLSSTISEMGGLAESQLAQCLVALRQNDSQAAEQVIAMMRASMRWTPPSRSRR